MSQQQATAIANPIALMLSRFLRRSDQKTALIRGAWGVGKTHAVTTFLDNFTFTDEIGVVARSRISLFGKQSISEIQREIFARAKQVASDEKTRARLGTAAHSLLQLEQFIEQNTAQKTLRWLSSKVGRVDVPWLGEVGALLSQGNFGLVDGFLITIDDLERRSDSIRLKDALGLVDELASSRDCKVIVICNEDALEKDDRGFLKDYKEKVFDIELLFYRSPREIASIALPESTLHRAVSLDILERLAISNIRVAKRYSFLVDQLWPELATLDSRVVKEVLEHVALLTWARYDSTAQIPSEQFGEIASESSWIASTLAEKEAPQEAWRSNWNVAATALEFSPEKYDAGLVEYLRTGLWSPGSFASDIDEKCANVLALQASEDLRNAWRIYSGSFDPDQDEFVRTMMKVLEESIGLLSPRDVDAAFSMLESLQIDVSALANRYIEEAKPIIENAARQDWPFSDFSSKALRPVIDEARRGAKNLPTIDAALERIAIQRSWSEEDIQTLASCTEDDLISWMESGPENLATKIRKGLLFFRTQSSDSRYMAIGEVAVSALRRIGSQSRLNELRVSRLFNISPADEEQPDDHQ